MVESWTVDFYKSVELSCTSPGDCRNNSSTEERSFVLGGGFALGLQARASGKVSLFFKTGN